MGTLTISNKYSVATFSYVDNDITLNGNAKYNKDNELTGVDGGQASRENMPIGNWYAYRDGEKMKVNFNNFSMEDMTLVLPIVQDCLTALEAED